MDYRPREGLCLIYQDDVPCRPEQDLNVGNRVNYYVAR